MKHLLFLFFSAILLSACQNSQPDAGKSTRPPAPTTEEPKEAQDSVTYLPEETMPTAEEAQKEAPLKKPIFKPSQNEAAAGRAASAPLPAAAPVPYSIRSGDFSDLALLDPSIRLDIRYATTDNFTKSKIYDCARCLLRPEAAQAVVKAHKYLQKRGLGLKMFDCYRPRPYQQRLWDKVPNPDYVTPPTKGSMHSRGAAVDLTLVDQTGNELDMGTPYDFFGVEAHTDHTRLPTKVLQNRRLLREALENAGFRGIRTEWWHFSFQGKNYPFSDYTWPCN